MTGFAALVVIIAVVATAEWLLLRGFRSRWAALSVNALTVLDIAGVTAVGVLGAASGLIVVGEVWAAVACGLVLVAPFQWHIAIAITASARSQR